jgi:hypothetical protein
MIGIMVMLNLQSSGGVAHKIDAKISKLLEEYFRSCVKKKLTSLEESV